MEGPPTGLIWSSERYRLRELVGSGGMSQVYRAWDNELDREVAVKVLHPHLANSEDSRRRFSREARAVAKLHHPHILEIFDFSGGDTAAAFIVTEFIRGTTLRKFAETVGFGLPQIGALAAHSLCQALDHAHTAGVVHRDLKPENVMVSEQGVLKLMDFGIARFLDAGEKMTMTGAMVGSPAYMAPEVIEGKEADARSDLFSLGTLLYWLLTGVLPFDAPNTSALLKRVLEVDYRDPRLLNSAISDSLATVCASLLRRDPATRPQSAVEVQAALAAALADDGLTEPGTELHAFLAGPANYRTQLHGQLLARFKVQAHHALASQRNAAALKAVDRLLALEPTDLDAHRLLGEISARQRRTQRWKHAGWALATLGGLALLALLALSPQRAARALTERLPLKAALALGLGPREPGDGAGTGRYPGDDRLPSEEGARESGGPGPAPSLTQSNQPASSADRPPQPTFAQSVSRALANHLTRSRPIGTPTRPVALPAPAASPTISLEWHVLPYAAVTVDGQPAVGLSPGGSPGGQIALSPGRHTLTFAAEAYEPLTEQVDVSASSPPLRHRLKPKPARLRVIADPSDASIMVDGEPQGTAADSAQRPIVLPLTKPEALAMVRIFKPGYRDVVRQIGLRANKDVTVEAALERQPEP